jgi:hypothetical protein
MRHATTTDAVCRDGDCGALRAPYHERLRSNCFVEIADVPDAHRRHALIDGGRFFFVFVA